LDTWDFGCSASSDFSPFRNKCPCGAGISGQSVVAAALDRVQTVGARGHGRARGNVSPCAPPSSRRRRSCSSFTLPVHRTSVHPSLIVACAWRSTGFERANRQRSTIRCGCVKFRRRRSASMRVQRCSRNCCVPPECRTRVGMRPEMLSVRGPDARRARPLSLPHTSIPCSPMGRSSGHTQWLDAAGPRN
jgi:hypothetical protein